MAVDGEGSSPEGSPCVYRSCSSSEASWVVVEPAVLAPHREKPMMVDPRPGATTQDAIVRSEADDGPRPPVPPLFRSLSMLPIGDTHTMAEETAALVAHLGGGSMIMDATRAAASSEPAPSLGSPSGPPPLFRSLSMLPIGDADEMAAETCALVAHASHASKKPHYGSHLSSHVSSRPLLVTASYRFDGLTLRGTSHEVGLLAAHATLIETPTYEQLRRHLRGCRTWWYAGADIGGLPLLATRAGADWCAAEAGRLLPLRPSSVSTSAASGTFSADELAPHVAPLVYAPSVDDICELVASAASDGTLRLVVLNACRTTALGRAIVERTSVEHVICWDTLAEDRAASIFGCALAAATASGKPPEEAFDAARAAVERQMESVPVDGVPREMPKYALDADPAQLSGGYRTAPRVAGAAHGPIAAGVPLCLRRLSPDALQARQVGSKRPASPAASEDAASSSALSSAFTRLDCVEAEQGFVDDEPVVYRSLALPALHHTAETGDGASSEAVDVVDSHQLSLT